MTKRTSLPLVVMTGLAAACGGCSDDPGPLACTDITTLNLNIANLDARYSYASWNMRDAVAGALQSQQYPLPTPAPGVSATTTAQSGSGVYFLAPRPIGARCSTSSPASGSARRSTRPGVACSRTPSDT